MNLSSPEGCFWLGVCDLPSFLVLDPPPGFLLVVFPLSVPGGTVCYPLNETDSFWRDEFIELVLKLDDAADKFIFFCHRGAGPFVSSMSTEND